MPEKELKMVMVIYYEAVDDEVMEVLDRCGMPYYTKVRGVFGKGELSGTRLGNDVWPGKNNVIYVACESETAGKIISGVEELRKQRSKEGIKAFVWTLEKMT